MDHLFNNYIQVGSIILFGVGFATLLLHNNLIKKIIGMNIMDTSIFLFFITIGYIDGREAPILLEHHLTSAEGLANQFVNPIPTGLMLTGIVVAVSITAFMLGLTIKLYEKYGTVELDEIMEMKAQDIEQARVC